MNLNSADRRKLETTLGELCRAVEDLLSTGLTTASESTRQSLQVAFQEASRLRLLRLGSTLRVANEELGRFTRNDPEFSRGRFAFFLNRAWLLGQGLARALKAGDEAAFDKLLWTPASAPADRLEVATLGVSKRVAANAFVAFDFRLRLVAPGAGLPAGQRLSWSCIFPLKPGNEIPPEAFLHLPQKQKFTAHQFLEGNTVVISNAAVSVDEHGQGRVSLGDGSTVASGEVFTDWSAYRTWDPIAARERVGGHEPGPFDLAVEMQEEVFLDAWEVGPPEKRDAEKQLAYPVESRGVTFSAVVAQGAEGKALKKAMDELGKKKKDRPPLFGLLHYEKCRLVLQPLTVFRDTGPDHLMLSGEKIDRAALLKALKF